MNTLHDQAPYLSTGNNSNLMSEKQNKKNKTQKHTTDLKNTPHGISNGDLLAPFTISNMHQHYCGLTKTMCQE